MDLFSDGPIIEGNFAFQNGMELTIKTASNTSNCLKNLKTANPNSPWAYIFFKDFFGGLIFGGSYFRTGLLLEGIFPCSVCLLVLGGRRETSL